MYQSRCATCNITVIKKIKEKFCPGCGEMMHIGKKQQNPSYRRNSDEELREAERKLQIDQTYENFMTLNMIRTRLGMELLPDEWEPRSGLNWGYAAGLPYGVHVAWGSRAIVTDHGADMVYHSLIGSENEKKELMDKLNRGLIAEMQDEIRRLLRRHIIKGDEEKEHLLLDRDGVVIIGNTNASYGYLYLIGFYKPEGWSGPTKYVEPPPPPPPAPFAPYHVARTYDLILGYRQPKMLSPDQIESILHRAKEALTAKSGAKTSKAFFGWLMKQHLQPEMREALEKALKEAKIKYKKDRK